MTTSPQTLHEHQKAGQHGQLRLCGPAQGPAPPDPIRREGVAVVLCYTAALWPLFLCNLPSPLFCSSGAVSRNFECCARGHLLCSAGLLSADPLWLISASCQPSSPILPAQASAIRTSEPGPVNSRNANAGCEGSCDTPMHYRGLCGFHEHPCSSSQKNVEEISVISGLR